MKQKSTISRILNAALVPVLITIYVLLILYIGLTLWYENRIPWEMIKPVMIWHVVIIAGFLIVAYIQHKNMAQIGSTCGFYAMERATKLLGKPRFGSHSKLWTYITHLHAVDRKTYVGEIFDSTLLYQILCDEFLPEHAGIELNKIKSKEELKGWLNKSYLMIVPVLRGVPHWHLVWYENGKYYKYESMFGGKVKCSIDKIWKSYQAVTKLSGSEFDWTGYMKEKSLFLNALRLCMKLFEVYAIAMNEQMHAETKAVNPKSIINMNQVILIPRHEIAE